jgi:hypothetical protein
MDHKGGIVEKLIARWSYWLGIACLIIAVVWRVLNAFGLLLPISFIPGHSIWYLSFFNGSILFFVTTIATACYAWLGAQRS